MRINLCYNMVMTSAIKNLFYLLGISLILYFTNFIAIKANLYWTTIWADMVTHTLGGMVVGGIVIFGTSLLRKQKKSLSLFIITLIVGIVWEVFELYTGMTMITDSGYYLDTFGDICFDLLGAYLSYSYLIKS